MSTEKWIAGSGVGLTWTTACGTEITTTAVGSGNAILSSVSIDNTTALDMFMGLSYVAGAALTTVAPAYLAFYLYPLSDDASHYGDGRFGSAAAGPPPGGYQIGTIGFAAAASTTIWGQIMNIPIIPAKFKIVLYNQAGIALPASGNTLKYVTYNRSVV